MHKVISILSMKQLAVFKRKLPCNVRLRVMLFYLSYQIEIFAYLILWLINNIGEFYVITLSNLIQINFYSMKVSGRHVLIFRYHFLNWHKIYVSSQFECSCAKKRLLHKNSGAHVQQADSWHATYICRLVVFCIVYS